MTASELRKSAERYVDSQLKVLENAKAGGKVKPSEREALIKGAIKVVSAGVKLRKKAELKCK